MSRVRDEIVDEPVDSSWIDAVGFDEGTETVQIVLRSGRVYRYYDVPESKVERFKHARSVGGYYNRVIKGQYIRRRLQ